MKCGVVVVVVGGWKPNLTTWDEEGSGKRRMIIYNLPINYFNLIFEATVSTGRRDCRTIVRREIDTLYYTVCRYVNMLYTYSQYVYVWKSNTNSICICKNSIYTYCS